MLRHFGTPNEPKIKFSILPCHFKLWSHQSKCWRLEFPAAMTNNWRKSHVNIISPSHVMSNSIAPSFVWKLLGIWNDGFRDCKYLKNDELWKHKNFPKTFQIKICKKLHRLVFVAFTNLPPYIFINLTPYIAFLGYLDKSNKKFLIQNYNSGHILEFYSPLVQVWFATSKTRPDIHLTNLVYDWPHKLPNDFRLRILGNSRKISIFTQYLTSFSSIDHLLCLCAQFFILFHLT